MGSHVAAPVLTPNIKYDSARDFIPIGPTAHSPAVIVARKDFPAKDLKEFVADLKEKGNGFKQAHGGIGSSSHMACLLFTTAIGAKPTLVAYRGTGPAMNDLIGGHVDFFCEQSVSVVEQVKSGTIKAYAVSAAERLACAAGRADGEGGRHQLPDEHLGRHLRAEGHAGRRWWRSSPARSTRRSTIDGVKQRIKNLGGSIPGKAERTPAAFDAYVKAEIARWAPILKAAAAEPAK